MVGIAHAAMRDSSPALAQYGQPYWYVASPRADHEEQVAQELFQRSAENDQPLLETRSSLERLVRQPRFATFCRACLRPSAFAKPAERPAEPTVIRFIGFEERPSALPEANIEAIQSYLGEQGRLEPRSYLHFG